jgi:hypothetical protein
MPNRYDAVIIVTGSCRTFTRAGINLRPGVSMAPGTNAAQMIFADLGLDFSNVTRKSRETLSPA